MITMDFETRSAADLKTAGPWKYAEDPTTEIICLSWAGENEEPKLWCPSKFEELSGDSCDDITPQIHHITTGGLVEAHNMEFERAVWHHIMHLRFGYPDLQIEQCRCSAAKAAVVNIPRSLEQACQVMSIDQQKDSAGARLMKKMAKPKKWVPETRTLFGVVPAHYEWVEDADSLRKLFAYCRQDVRAERALSSALPDLSVYEQKVWELDQRINMRGIGVDVASIREIIKLIEASEIRSLRHFKKLTGIDSPKQGAFFLQWLLEQGVPIPDLTADTVEATLEEELPDIVRQALTLRQGLAKASVRKLNAMAGRVQTDGRCRSTTMFHGAGTGRWSGKAIQPQNFPSRGLIPHPDKILKDIMTGDLDWIEMLYGSIHFAVSSLLRHLIKADEGKELICADYSAIESRVLAWLAGEEQVLQDYRNGKSSYIRLASMIYNVPYETIEQGHKAGDKKYTAMRADGKTGILACGYQGGVKAVWKFAPSMPEEKAFMIRDGFRKAHPMIVKFWKEIERCVREAINNPGCITKYRLVSFVVHNEFLICRLPSGRRLYYFSPRIEDGDILFWGVDSKTRKWAEKKLYGGLLTENITQAVARDLLVNGMLNVEAHGYEIVIHVHDEAASEVEKGFGNLEEYEMLLCELPEWAEGLPLEAEGWVGERYRK